MADNQETTQAEVTYFFSSCDGDEFMIPTVKRERWEDLTLNDPETDEECETFEDEFGEYRVGGSISGIEFIVVKQ